MSSSNTNGDQQLNVQNMGETLAIEEPHEHTHSCLMKILTKFQEHLVECSRRSLGFSVNLNCEHYGTLSPLQRFHVNNAGDPFKECNFAWESKKFERGVLEWFAQLWGIEKDEYWGYITNGGTEGNLQALLLGRELFPHGVLYVSRDSHYSIFKAAKMFRMKCTILDTLCTGEIDCSDLEKKLILNKNKPAIIVANIGSTFKGGVDNLDVVVKTLYECGFSDDRFYIHCDAALNGLISPLLEQEPSLSFKKPIGSIAVSAHKLLGSPVPCGVVITRKKYIPLLAKSIEYIDSVDSTISGSRNGHAAVSIWYGLSIKGLVGLQKEVKVCLRNARYLRDELRNAGIGTMLNENSNIVVFERPLNQSLTVHWQLSCQGNMAHIVVMPHVTIAMLDDFINDVVRERITCLGAQPPCLGEEIGILNCACPKHSDGVAIGR